MAWYGGFAPYVPVAQRRAQGKKKAQKRIKKGESLQPIEISGRGIARTFWGKSWCTHFEQYSDYANRLPRGRTYARNGSIADLRITQGKVTSMVCGSSLYDVTITIDPLAKSEWSEICEQCNSSILSLVDLMRGKLGDDVIRRVTDPQSGMFPSSKEIKLRCNCPDGAYLCKHLAATLYGVGHRLDTSPELLFLLRGVDQNELISQAITAENASAAMGLDSSADFVGEDLGAMFGIEMADTSSTETPASAKKATKKPSVKKKPKKKRVAKRTAKKKATSKKTSKKKNVNGKAAKKKTAKRSAKKRSTPQATRKRKKTPASEITIRLN